MSTADVASHLCYGVVFDPAHFQGQEDLPAKNTQFLDDGSDPGRTPEGTVSLSILSPKGKVNPKTKTGQRTAYSSPSETVYFTRPLVLSPNVTTPLASAFKLHPALENPSAPIAPYMGDYLWGIQPF